MPEKPTNNRFLGLSPFPPEQAPSEEALRSVGGQTLAAWLETLGQLQRCAADSQPLFDLASQAVVNPGGLDGCLILKQQHGSWEVIASHPPCPDAPVQVQRDIVDLVIATGKPHYHAREVSSSQDAAPAKEIDASDGPASVTPAPAGPAPADPAPAGPAPAGHAAAVFPVMNADQKITTIVYGFRSLHHLNKRRCIRFFEAQFMQVVCDSLSAGMVRLRSEAKVAESRVLLHQAFPPSIAQMLCDDPSALRPQTQEITALFCDLRKFSAIAERSSAELTYEFLADVMDQFSNAVIDLDGVIVDFYGDGLSAFWNAPVAQPMHALLACQAAKEILKVLDNLNLKWESRIGQEIEVGIGIHTGTATVGNSGSYRRLKYGPRGKTVNIASRLESLTKEFEVPLLVSKETASQVEDFIPMVSVATTVLRGHQEEFEVFTIRTDDVFIDPTKWPEVAEPTVPPETQRTETNRRDKPDTSDCG